MHPLCKILNTPVMSILCLVKQNDGTWVEKHQRFSFNVYKRFFYFYQVFLRFFNVFLFFFWNVFYIYVWHHNLALWCQTVSCTILYCRHNTHLCATNGVIVQPCDRLLIIMELGYFWTNYYLLYYTSVLKNLNPERNETWRKRRLWH